MTALIVGDIVDYWPAQGRPDDFAYFDASQPCMGTVVYVFADGSVNLRVLDQYGKPFNESQVAFVANKVGDALPKDQHYVTLRTLPEAYQTPNVPTAIEQLQLELDKKAAKLDRLAHAVDATPGGAAWRQEQSAEQNSETSR